jgi:hypothetical protein
MGQLEFVPVAEPSAATDGWGRTLTHWKETDYLFHPWLLSKGATRAELQAPQRCGIIYQPKPDLTAAQVSDWFNSVGRRGDICLTTANPNPNFETKLERTFQSAMHLMQHKTDEYALYGVVCGSDFPSMERWLMRMDSLGEWDGWSFSPSNPERLVAMMTLAHRFFKKKPVHVNGPVSLSVLSYLARHIDAKVTVSVSVPKNQWLLPGQTVFGLPNPLPDVPDDCPVCSLNGPEQFGAEPRLMLLHNLCQIERSVRLFNSVRERDVLWSLTAKEDRAALDAFDLYLTEGYTKFQRRENLFGAKHLPGQTMLTDFEPSQGMVRMCDVCLVKLPEGDPIPVGDGKFLSVCNDCRATELRLEITRGPNDG